MKNLITIVAVLSFISGFAQQKTGIIEGSVVDSSSTEVMPFVNILLLQNEVPVNGTTSNFDGEFKLSNLDEGIYDLLINYVGYKTKSIKGIKVSNLKASLINVELSNHLQLIMEIPEHNGPAIPSPIEKMEKIKCKTVTDIAKTSCIGLISKDFNYEQRQMDWEGPRDAIIFVGCTVIRTSYSYPKTTIYEVSVRTAGISAQYENNCAAPNSKRLTIRNSKTDNNIYYTNKFEKTIINKTI